MSRIRDFPEGETPEETMRQLMMLGGPDSRKSADAAIKYLYDIMEECGPFEGIIGYSEGATVAGSLLLSEQIAQEQTGRKRMFKCAIFFAGWPPMDPQTYRLVLADESPRTVDIPTCHISK
jgi:hypothetical protein